MLRRSCCAEGVFVLLLGLVCGLFMAPARAELSDTVVRVKPSVVAIGTYQRTRAPARRFLGTGFAVGDGSLVATNAHVLPLSTDAAALEQLVVIVIGPDLQEELRAATLLVADPAHDLALLKLQGPPLQPLKLATAAMPREGQAIAFTGFPIIGALGLNPATHRGVVAALTPIVIPQASSAQLNAQSIRRVRDGAFTVLQLDATAYPGNSGSPVYDPDSGEVLAVINMVWVKGAKESALSAPSGITYAVPVSYLLKLIASAQR